ncbi:MAG TPA: GNAT family acetyltransferase [Rhodoblastus sp.]|nr:GNAT family acetyltransferase [Rhodoblastus sp.]
MTLSISDLRPDETEAAVALWEACGLTRPWNDPRADIALALGKPSSTVLAGRIDERLVATAMTGSDGHRGWVYYLAVAPDRRRSGFGAAMMQAAADWLGARGVPKLHVMIRSENLAVAAFYERLGYARSDTVTMARPLPRSPCSPGAGSAIPR